MCGLRIAMRHVLPPAAPRRCVPVGRSLASGRRAACPIFQLRIWSLVRCRARSSAALLRLSLAATHDPASARCTALYVLNIWNCDDRLPVHPSKAPPAAHSDTCRSRRVDPRWQISQLQSFSRVSPSLYRRALATEPDCVLVLVRCISFVRVSEAMLPVLRERQHEERTMRSFAVLGDSPGSRSSAFGRAAGWLAWRPSGGSTCGRTCKYHNYMRYESDLPGF
ncbi:hypothetical protein L226DRAFT_341666 [Lentinus tigrinus ALCF2SS1-7]|uniref:Uncharacterized protein n=1 Tax=Lentinus tigrinus ALCF2SS1-6 TaxID=1328759 RepID=A0A5C2RXF6_9APHY|nr:hypothetical protein L227DRAFT_300009 [Lentinus tigrinus ALCF2SS1-6]RPD68548.1 hypothetical protein L226DRAFT_341666 [Lentinus tigrinus ALCF2SS1-7]